MTFVWRLEPAAKVSVVTAMWRGLVEPSTLAFTTMLGVFVTVSLLIGVALTPATIAGPLGAYFPRSIKDSEGFATREALQLATSTATDRPRLIVIGNSIVAQSFASGALTSRDLAEATGRPWHVSMLTTPLQGPLDEAALADVATQTRPAVVMLSLGFERYGAPPGEYRKLYQLRRLGLRSEWADGAARALGISPFPLTGIYAVDNSSFLLRNAGAAGLRLLSQSALVPRVDTFLLDPPLTTAQRIDRRAKIHALFLKGVHPDPLAIDMLANTVRRLQERGSKVILFEQPISPGLFDGAADRALYRAYLAKSAAIATAMGAFYCRPDAAREPGPSEFPDYLHLGDPLAQGRLRRSLASCAAVVGAPGGRL